MLKENKIDLTKYEAIIFDLDGTLIDSMWVWDKVDEDYLGRFGYKDKKGYQKLIEGMTFLETAVFTKDYFGLQDSVDEIMDDWTNSTREQYENHVKLKCGAKKLLDYSKSNGIKLGIATSNSRELAEVVLRANGVIDYFEYILTGTEVVKGKPDPKIYLDVASMLGVDSCKCLVFEDVVNGIMAGLNARMDVCAIYDDHCAHLDEEKRKLAHYYINDFTELEY